MNNKLREEMERSYPYNYGALAGLVGVAINRLEDLRTDDPASTMREVKALVARLRQTLGECEARLAPRQAPEQPLNPLPL